VGARSGAFDRWLDVDSDLVVSNLCGGILRYKQISFTIEYTDGLRLRQTYRKKLRDSA